MKVTLLQNGESIAELDLDQGEYTVGSAEGNTIVIEDPSISPNHARLLQDSGQVCVEDRDSEKGTFVDGNKTVGRTALHDGAELRLGDFEVSLSMAAQSEAAQPEEQPEPTSTGLPEAGQSRAQDQQATSSATERASRLGKGILGVGSASMREAGRGAKLASLKAQIEKLRRIDLHNAHVTLGRKAFESGVMAQMLAEQYAAVRELEAQIGEKRQGLSAEADAGVMAKARAKALTAKMRAEAELLVRKRNGLLAEVGKKIAESPPDQADIATEVQTVAAVVERISELEASYSATVGDHSARDALVSSAKASGKGGGLQTNPTETKPGTQRTRSGLATASCVLGLASLPLLLARPLGRVIAFLALVLGIWSLIQLSKKRNSLSGLGFAITGVVVGALVIQISLLAGLTKERSSSSRTAGTRRGGTVQQADRGSLLSAAREEIELRCRAAVRNNAPLLLMGYAFADYEVVSVNEIRLPASLRSEGYKRGFRADVRLYPMGRSGTGAGSRRESFTLLQGGPSGWLLIGYPPKAATQPKDTYPY